MTKEQIVIDVITETWTGKNIKAIKKFLSQNLIRYDFVDDNLYINRLGGYIEINSKLVYLEQYNILFIEKNI
jgi:hypothetical protein